MRSVVDTSKEKVFRRFDRVQTTKCARQSWTVMCKIIMIKKEYKNELGGSGDIAVTLPHFSSTSPSSTYLTQMKCDCVCAVKCISFPSNIVDQWPSNSTHPSTIKLWTSAIRHKQPWLYQPTLSSLNDQIICFAFLNKFIQTY